MPEPSMPPYSVVSPQSIASLMYYAARAPEGAVVEIGVYRGGTAWHLAKLGRPLYLYDTFTGMPYRGELDGNAVGSFSDTSAQAVRELLPQAHVIEGLFPHSLMDMPPVGFVHADADQYESTKSILECLPPRMVRGGFILLDDFGVPGCDGCTQAVRESRFPVLVIAETGKALIVV